ncbi:MAG: WD40 repeat domain-containing protein, partial [Maioricimonas sp. JB049]
GRFFACKDCGNRVTVPGGDDPDDGFEPPRATLPPPTARRPKKKSLSASRESSSGAGMTIVMSIVGLVAVIGAVLVGVRMMGAGGGAPAGGAAAPVAADPAAPAENGAAAQPAAAQPTAAAPAATQPTNLSTPSNLAIAPSETPQPVIEWTVQPDPVPAIEWPEHYTKKVKVDGDVSKMIFPSTPSQFAAHGIKAYDASQLEVVDLVTGRRAGRIQGQPAKFTKSALSPDGQLVAFHVLDNDVRTRVQVWSAETGQMINELRCDENRFNLSIVDFAGPGQLISYSFGKPEGATKFVHRIRIIDIETGDLVRELSDPIKVDANHWALSPGRRYLATRDSSKVLLIYDLQDGRLVASRDITPGGTWSIEHFAFSHTGDRLAVLMNELEGCMVKVLDVGDGETLDEFTFSARLENVIPGTTYEGPQLEWLPGDVGWLLGGTLVVDAGSGRRLWMLKTAKNDYNLDNPRRRVPVADGFVSVAGRDGRAQFERLRFDFSEAIATIAGVAADEEALLKPGMPVSIEVDAQQVRFGTPEETAEGLKETLARKLEQDGFLVEEGQPVVLKVAYREGSAGTFTQRQGLNPLRAEPTGKSIEGTMAAIALEWRANKRKLWEDSFEYKPRILFIRGKELTDEAARDQMFKSLGAQLAGRPIAYYVSADGRRQLPVTVEIPRY